MSEENLFTKDKPLSRDILLNILISVFLIGLVYILPEPIAIVVTVGYAAFLNLMTFIYLILYIFSFGNGGGFDRLLDKSVKRHLKNENILFMKRVLNPNRFMIHLAFVSGLFLVVGFVVGTMVNSLYVTMSLSIWACIFFLTVDRSNTKTYTNHREEIKQHLKNKQST